MFDDEQKKEIGGVVRTVLGLEDDQSLDDKLTSTLNETLNRYDKRVKKDREKERQELDEKLGEIAEAVKAKPPKGGDPTDGDDPPADLDGVDLKKLPEGVRHLISSMNQKVKDLTETVSKAQERAQKEEAERKKIEAEREATGLRSAVRDALLRKDEIGAEYDPADIDVLVDRVAANVRRQEKGDGYVYQTGVDDVTGDPVFKPLLDGLKEFGKTSLAKRFQRATPGSGPTPPSGKSGTPGGEVSLDQVAGMTPAQIREASAAGKIQFNQ